MRGDRFLRWIAAGDRRSAPCGRAVRDIRLWRALRRHPRRPRRRSVCPGCRVLPAAGSAEAVEAPDCVGFPTHGLHALSAQQMPSQPLPVRAACLKPLRDLSITLDLQHPPDSKLQSLAARSSTESDALGERSPSRRTCQRRAGRRVKWISPSEGTAWRRCLAARAARDCGQGSSPQLGP